jgi:sugar lactone lactonase YvrE
MRPQAIGHHLSEWGEGPLWHAGRLLYVDIEGHKIIAFSPATGMERVWDVGQRAGTVVPRAGGGLIWAGDEGIFSLDEASGASTAICDPEAAIATNRFNDGKCDPAGRFWAGTMDMNSPRSATGSLYCLHTDLRLEKMYSPVTISNGLVWSHNARTMYYIDSPRRNVLAFDYDLPSGAITGERVAWDTRELPGVPDGMTIDAEGRLWIAFCHGSCVVCWNPATGRIEEKIEFPTSETTACAFGGPGLDQLYVTTGARPGVSDPLAGRLFVCEPGARGVEGLAFAG